MDELQLFRNSSTGIDYVLNDNITIHHPTLNEICEFGEQKYYSMVTSLTCSPAAYKVAIWDILKTYWTEISDYEFFLWMCSSLPLELTAILLGDLDLSKLHLAHNNETNQKVLVTELNGELSVVIDKALYFLMSDYIRKMHGFEKLEEPVAADDEHTKKYMIDRERKKIKRNMNKENKSMLKPLISSMVNHNGFKYNYSTVWDLPISAFNESVSKIQKYVTYTQTMQGVYSGCIDLKKSQININELNWLS